MNVGDQAHRATLFVEDAEVVTVNRYPDDQYVLRLAAPKCAAGASAGSFIHLRCDDAIPMRRPLSIMRADADQGTLDVLFKVVGDGLKALGRCSPGDVLSCIGPIGHGFEASPDRPNAVLIGGGVGIPPMIFLAEQLHDENANWRPLVLMGSEIEFPFARSNASTPASWAGPGCTMAMDDLETVGIPSRLASRSEFAGTYRGFVTELAEEFLASLTPDELMKTALFACGPTIMLEAAARLAARHSVPCQVSLEEYMACAVGGCAGCAVPVLTDNGTTMQRVCVDGPVFEAASVFPQAAATTA